MTERILSGKIKQLVYTTEELSQSPLSTTVIDNGVLVYEKTSSGQIKCKMGDGNNVWSGLNYIEDSDKMDKNNPTGTGSLSLNRVEGSIIGENSVALGCENIASEQCSYAEGLNNVSGNYDRFSITSKKIGSETIDNVNMIYMDVAFSGETFPISVNDHIYIFTISGIIESSVQNIISTNINNRFKIFKIYVNENEILNSIINDVDIISSILIIYTNNNSDGSACPHSEGYLTISNGYASHSEGFQTKASGYGSHAEGTGTIASGYEGSHAEGRDTIASGNGSHAEGTGTIASSDYQHVQGQYNIEDTSNTYAHIVGGGTGDSNRKNIHTLDWNGNAVFSGDVTATKSDGTEVSLLSLKSTLDSIQVQNFYTGIEAPSNTLGEDGDLYLIT